MERTTPVGRVGWLKSFTEGKKMRCAKNKRVLAPTMAETVLVSSDLNDKYPKNTPTKEHGTSHLSKAMSMSLR